MKPKYKQRSEETTQRHIEFLKNKSNFDCVMIGTSMLERFVYDTSAKNAFKDSGLSKLNIFNCGVGGDKICNILYRLDTMHVLDYVVGEPKCVILECGANDIGERTFNEKQLSGGVKLLIDIIRKKFSCPIYLIGVFPRRSKDVDDKSMVKRTMIMNNALQILSTESQGVSFVDLSQSYLNDNDDFIDEYFVDDVHFSEKGYNIFAKHLYELINCK